METNLENPLSRQNQFSHVNTNKAWKWKSLNPVQLFGFHGLVHGIVQARILDWVAFLFSRGSSQPRDQTQLSCIAGGFFTSWGTREAQEYWSE